MIQPLIKTASHTASYALRSQELEAVDSELTQGKIRKTGSIIKNRLAISHVILNFHKQKKLVLLERAL